MDNIYIFDAEGISISIIEKNEKAAYKILAANVISPEKFTKESEFSVDDLTID